MSKRAPAPLPAPSGPTLVLLLNIQHARLPIPVRELRFATSLLSPAGRPRQWAFDLAWPHQRLAVEIQGGVWGGGWNGGPGAHARPTNIIRDMEKGNAAVLLGWDVLRYTPDHIDNGTAIAGIIAFFRALRAPIQTP